MAIAEMQKARMALHKSISDELFHELQKLGCCQFIAQSQEKVRERDVAPLRAKLRRVDDLLGEARFAIRFLDPFATEKGGGMAKAFGELPEYTLDALSEIASEDRFMALAAQLHELEKRLSDTKAGISKATGLKLQLLPLIGLPHALDLYGKGTDLLQGSIFSVSMLQAKTFAAALLREFGDMADIDLLPAEGKAATQLVAAIYPRADAEKLQEALTGFQATRVEVPQQFGDTAINALTHVADEIDALWAEETKLTTEISALANDAYRTTQLFSDYWTIQKDKLSALIEGEQTEQIQLFSFWVPKGALQRFEKVVAPYRELAEVVMTEPEEDELPPTLLINQKWSSAMEALTTMYGTPTYGGLDPTTLITPFFYLFFGMCFGDAGYGLVISSLLIAIMLKKRVTGTLKKFMVILTVGNLVALVYGALTFSWFGDAVSAFSFMKPLMPLQRFQVLDPMNDPMTLLYISLALGFVQIMFGLLLAMAGNLKNGDKMAAFGDQGGWIVFLCGLVLVGLSAAGVIPLPMKLSAVVAAAGALVLIATQGRSKRGVFSKLFSGVLSLYNVTGYLGDILSYSRLLALGLGSAAVGMVINLLANLVSGTAYIGIPLAILIFVIGHLFSVAVNMLGAFVHALRLQYVEFFGKFYEASGGEFAPLSMNTQHVKLAGQTEKA